MQERHAYLRTRTGIVCLSLLQKLSDNRLLWLGWHFIVIYVKLAPLRQEEEKFCGQDCHKNRGHYQHQRPVLVERMLSKRKA